MQSCQMRLEEGNGSGGGSHPRITPVTSRRPRGGGNVPSENGQMGSGDGSRQEDALAINHPPSAFRFRLSVLIWRLGNGENGPPKYRLDTHGNGPAGRRSHLLRRVDGHKPHRFNPGMSEEGPM